MKKQINKEMSELLVNIDNLTKFMENNDLRSVDRSLIKIQLETMKTYQFILQQRLEWCNY